ncbi:hypothetical protein HPULCUR_010439 [Helicostylum pulchrum]|uniref:Uncharacterized protein n=1 Tax=Helicostylum pulchrum TaxID=562976 RepID=A0ABP9YD92_9FUNG
MRTLLLFFTLTACINALVNDVQEDCMITTPIGNTIVTAGEKMKIMWTNSHVGTFPSIYLVQSDGNGKPIILASDVVTDSDYMTLGEAPYHCNSGNLRIVGANSIMPEPKTPGGLDNQISSGRFPKSASSAHSFVYLPITILVTILASFVFMLSL